MKRSKKLFSIYRSRQLDPSLFNSKSNQDSESQVKYFTSMHHYKRDLSPLKETFASCNDKTPYRSNFQDYEGSLITQNFKDELLINLGQGVKCVTQTSNGMQSGNRTIQTFLIESDFRQNKPLEVISESIPLINSTATNIKEKAAWMIKLENRRLMQQQQSIIDKSNASPELVNETETTEAQSVVELEISRIRIRKSPLPKIQSNGN